MITTRRAMIATLAMSPMIGAMAQRAEAARAYAWPLAVQLWSVNTELDEDFTGSLRSLARLGFREVETAGLHGRAPDVFRQALKDAGLRAVSAHYSMPDLFTAAPARIAEAKALGVDWIVASSPRPDRQMGAGPWLDEIRNAMTLDAWRANAAKLNEIGQLAQVAGLQLAYHNHPLEFDRYDGQRGFDVLISDTDAALVKLELDVAWAVAGGADPLQLMQQHRDRIKLIHIKGLRHKPMVGQYGTDFTTGIVGLQDVIDWRSVLSMARKIGVRHAFIEQEPPHVPPIMTALAACRDYLSAL